VTRALQSGSTSSCPLSAALTSTRSRPGAVRTGWRDRRHTPVRAAVLVFPPPPGGHHLAAAGVGQQGYEPQALVRDARDARDARAAGYAPVAIGQPRALQHMATRAACPSRCCRCSARETRGETAPFWRRGWLAGTGASTVMVPGGTRASGERALPQAPPAPAGLRAHVRLFCRRRAFHAPRAAHQRAYVR
jgi:hypothetical protein